MIITNVQKNDLLNIIEEKLILNVVLLIRNFVQTNI